MIFNPETDLVAYEDLNEVDQFMMIRLNELTKELKTILLNIPTLEVIINGKRSPLMVAVAQTTASLYKCFTGELRRIIYPEK